MLYARRAPPQIPPDCLPDTAVDEWDMPSTSSAEHSASSLASSRSSFSRDGARAQMTPNVWHGTKVARDSDSSVARSSNAEVEAPIALGRLPPELPLSAFERRGCMFPMAMMLVAIRRRRTQHRGLVDDVALQPVVRHASRSTVPGSAVANAGGPVAERIGQPWRPALDDAIREHIQ